MKFVERPDREVETQGLGESAQMTIKADARAFRNLVDSIYAEKEKTVVRELIANAFDAHAAAGCPDREIVVHLPTTFEPTFSVRDYGVGMSHEFIMKHYTCLFDSSKQGDNSQTGMFGVGSKSPLAITDSFIVKCYDPPDVENNITARIRRYSVHIPAAGVPTISRTFDSVPEDVTDEDCRGVEIIVPIERGSREKLLTGLAEQQFFWFDKPIRFEGAFDEVKASVYSTIVKLTDGLYYAPKAKDHYNPNWKLYARQGAAVYPVLEGQVREYLNKNVLETIRELCNKGNHVLLDFPLGTAEVTLAREAIQYGDATRLNIATCINNSFAALAAQFQTAIGNKRTMREAHRAVVDTLHGDYDKADWATIKLCSSLLPIVQPYVQDNYHAWIKSLTQDQKDALNEWDRLPPTPSRSMTNGNYPEGKVLLHQGKVSYKSISIESPKSTLTFRHPHVVYIIPSHLQKWQDRLKKHVDESKDFTEAKCNANIDCYVIRCAKRSVDAVVAALKDADVYTKHYTIDDLPQFEDAEVRQRTSSKTSVYKWDGGKFGDSKVEPDYLSPAYYVTRIGISSTEVSFETIDGNVTNDGRVRRVGHYNLESILRLAYQLGIISKDVPVYRVTENQGDKIEKSAPAWQHLPDVLFNAAELLSKAATGILDLRQSNLYSHHCYKFEEHLCRAYRDSSTLTAHARLRDLYDMLAKADPIFRIMAGFKLAKGAKKDGELLTGDEVLSSFLAALNMTAEVKASKRLEHVNQLTTEYDNRYEYLAHFFDHGYSNTPSEGLLTHLEIYASGLIAKVASQKHTIDPSAFKTLEPFGTYFDQQAAKFNVIPEDQINDEAA